MKKWFVIRIATGICAALGWWGLLYPQLALTPDTVAVVPSAENGVMGEEQSLKWDFDGSLYLDLLNAGSDKIVFRFKIFKDLNSLLEAFRNGD